MLKRIALFACLAAPTAASAGTMTLQYPAAACDKILSQEYSTGGGDTMFQYMEILCLDTQGKYTGFVVEWKSTAGFLGFGRMTIPEKFIYEPYNGNVLQVK